MNPIFNGPVRIQFSGSITIPSSFISRLLQLSTGGLPDGTIIHFEDELVHRTDGPAVIYPDGSSYWCIEGRFTPPPPEIQGKRPTKQHTHR
jgi:hypothetical protein